MGVYPWRLHLSFVVFLGCESTGCGSVPPPLDEPADDMSGFSTWSATYTWFITDWSEKSGGVHRTETFSAGGHNW